MTSATAIFLVAFVASSNNFEATSRAAEAYAAQERIDKALDHKYRETFTRDQRETMSAAALVTHAMIEHKLVLRWEFP